MNKMKTNYHTHTTFCDGRDSPEKMVLAAIDKGFHILGFSGHSMFPFSSTWHTPCQQHEAYIKEIKRLRHDYSGKIEILCGFEADWLPRFAMSGTEYCKQFAPDYLIGSVHYIVTEKGQFTVDDSAENVLDGVARFFGGDARAAVCEYFSQEREMLRKGGFTILGHCDLFRKRNGVLKLFDENESWYREEIRATAKEIARAGVIAEINTGAIARQAMQSCYPSDEFLALLHDARVPVTINSDAHNAETLDCAFDIAEAAAKKAGYTETFFLRHDSDGKIEAKSQPL